MRTLMEFIDRIDTSDLVSKQHTWYRDNIDIIHSISISIRNFQWVLEKDHLVTSPEVSLFLFAATYS